LKNKNGYIKANDYINKQDVEYFSNRNINLKTIYDKDSG